MRLSKWSVEGYRSIGEGRFEPRGFNILIGKNNTGKSNIVKSLTEYAAHFGADFDNPSWENNLTRSARHDEILLSYEFALNEGERRELYTELDEHGIGQEYLDLCDDSDSFTHIAHDLRYSPSEGIDDRWTTNFPHGMTIVRDRIDGGTNLAIRDLPPTEINGSSNSAHFANTLSNLVSASVRTWELASAFREPRNVMQAGRTDVLADTGEDLVQAFDTMVRNFPAQFRRVEETYTEIMRGVTGLRTPFTTDRHTTIMVDEEGYSDGFSLDEISSGSKEILTLLTKIAKAEDSADILLIEEPELHIHPGAQQALYDLIHEISKGAGPQVILTTHSDVFVNQTDTNSIISVKRDIDTVVETAEEEGIDELLESLGYEKSDVLQSDAVVFPEGVSDQAVFGEFAKTLAAANQIGEPFDESGITLHPLGGDRMKRHGGELHIVIPKRILCFETSIEV